MYSNGCEGLSGEIKYLEYVQLVLSMTYPKRGDIQIAMKSPLGNIFFYKLVIILLCLSICEISEFFVDNFINYSIFILINTLNIINC